MCCYIPGLPAELDKTSLERSFEAALKRFSRGFLKTVALHTPPPPARQYGMPQLGKSFSLLREKLSEEYNVRSAGLEEGQVPEEADILLLAAPERLSEKQLFAVDQFLMRGGTVVVSSSPFDIALQRALSARRSESGLRGWLEHHGITLEESMVLDPQNAAFPIPVQRLIGGFSIGSKGNEDLDFNQPTKPSAGFRVLSEARKSGHGVLASSDS